jgi:hypothetical protein
MHLGQQQMVFVQPSSNLLGSGPQPLLGFAGRNGRTRLPHSLPQGLELAFVRPRRLLPNACFLGQSHDPPHRVSVRPG